jgi:beta-hydroxylase
VTAGVVPFGVVLGAWTASALYVHFRGRERLRFMRQLADHSTFLAPYNTLVYLFSGVPRTPRQRVEDFPALAPLQAHWQTIRDEALALQQAGQLRKAATHNDLAFNSFYKRDWRRFYLKWYGDFLPSARALCPRTVALLQTIPSVHAAMFALLAPQSRLVRHRDPFAGSLRYHLGLVTPSSDACRIFIDGVPYHWRDGEAVLFDETYIHRAENRTDTPRIILFCDVERPLRTRTATAVNRFVIARLMGATATANLEGERIGVLNRVFEQVYRVRVLAKRIKARSRTTYYVLSYSAKLAMVGVLLYLLLG